MANTMITADVTPFENELRKAAAECGWNERSQTLILLRFIAGTGRLRVSLLSEFKSFLKAASREEQEMVESMPVPYHGARATAEDDEMDEELEDDEDDLDDDDLDDEDDLDDDDFDDEDDDLDDEDDDLDDEDDDLDDDLDDEDDDDLEEDEEDDEE